MPCIDSHSKEAQPAEASGLKAPSAATQSTIDAQGLLAYSIDAGFAGTRSVDAGIANACSVSVADGATGCSFVAGLLRRQRRHLEGVVADD
eukprot:CAMPEP_0170442616 /NCGR_PEP_ID=MMETSP0117_2-20130122/47521_1 /TAXON_ID=400756 /ORGANISM="Durinskia baltica, Strain CSIRO CS-38" /LENGTH=90 /DNA_ID=CAMNT_0010703233 /DNA_START=18 /DNA_END=290 /DNA_ORIENTATION=-